MKRAMAALVLCTALLAACGGGGNDDDDRATGGDAGGSAAEAPATGRAPAGQPADAAGTGGGAGETSSQAGAAALDRKVIFTSSIDLQVEDVAVGFATVQRLAREAGGYVEQSSMARSRDDDGPRSATLTLRIPADRNGDVVASLRTIAGARVLNETSRATEVTEEYTDLDSRLRNLERTEMQYLDLLAKAQSIEDILTVSDRLNNVRGQIEQVRGRLRVLDDMVDLASIDVSLALLPARVASDGDSGPWSFGEAFASAWERAVETGRYLLAASAVALVAAIWLAAPAAVLLAVVWLARRVGRRPIAPVDHP